MVQRREYLDALERTGGRVLLLSGGGNDMVAGGELAAAPAALRPAADAGGVPAPSFDRHPRRGDRRHRADRARRRPRLPAGGGDRHGYDYAIPADGKWLGKPMKSRGIKDPGLQKAIAAMMIDRLQPAAPEPGQPVAAVHLRRLPRRGRATGAGTTSCTRPTRAMPTSPSRSTPRSSGSRPRAPPGRRGRQPSAPAISLRARSRGPRRDPARGGGRQGLLAAHRAELRRPGHYEGWDGELDRLRVRRRRHGRARRARSATSRDAPAREGDPRRGARRHPGDRRRR